MDFQLIMMLTKKGFLRLKGPRTGHVRHIKLSGDMNNNKMGAHERRSKRPRESYAWIKTG
jgi:hypothetical protein